MRALSFRFLTSPNGSGIYNAQTTPSHSIQPECGKKPRNKPFGYTPCLRDTPLWGRALSALPAVHTAATNLDTRLDGANMKQHPEFETSAELKRIFVRELDAWHKQSHLGLQELSQRCGVSQSYLAHVGRYGRIPSKPVLLLLALNFGMAKPEELLRAASETDTWPFDGALRLATRDSPEEGFLSVKLNMRGLLDAIQGAIRSEAHPKSLTQLLAGRPLRIGLNFTQPWLFGRLKDGSPDSETGAVPELCRLLSHYLGCEVETIATPFDRYVERLCRGDIDLFGPLLVSPFCPSHIKFTLPTHRMGLSLLMRLRPTSGLAPLEPPSSLEDLLNRRYALAALKDSRAHHFCVTRLKRSEDSVIVCSSVEEALDRVLLRGVPRPAHLFVTNAMFAIQQAREHAGSLAPLFANPGHLLEMSDNAFAVRPEWTDALGEINAAVKSAAGSTGFQTAIQTVVSNEAEGLMESVYGAGRGRTAADERDVGY